MLTAGGGVCTVYTVYRRAVGHGSLRRVPGASGPIEHQQWEGSGPLKPCLSPSPSRSSGRRGKRQAPTTRLTMEAPSFPLAATPPSPSPRLHLHGQLHSLKHNFAILSLSGVSTNGQFDRDQRSLPSWSPRSLALLCQSVPAGFA